MAYPGVRNLAVASIFVFCIICGESVQAQEAEKGRVIRQIDIRGNKRIGTAAIKGSIQLREGDLYSPEVVSQDVSSIWAMGYFDDVEVILEDVPEGVKLTFLVTERPVIKAIIFDGNDEMKTGKLENALEFRERDYLKRYLVKLGEDRIKELYLDKGFQFVKVSSTVKKVDRDVEVIYDISEGPRVTVRKVMFEGNKSFTGKKLDKQIKTRRRRFPSFLFKGIFDKEKFNEDKERLKDYYIDKGWLDVSVGGKLTYDKGKEQAIVTFIIDEGERYYVNKIEVKGNRLYSTEALLDDMILYAGGPFLPPVMEEDTRSLRTQYGEQGFVNARVIPKKLFSPAGANLDLVYEIKEGQRHYIEEIKIRGNEKTEDHVIRRELTFFPGDRFDTVKIRDSHEKLMATGYFDRQAPMPVNMLSEQGSQPDRANIIVDVTEGRTGVLRFGGGFGVNSGLFGDISYTDNNFNALDFPKNLHDFLSGDAFRGAGQIFNVKLSPGLKRTEAIISLTNPSVFDSVYSAGGSVFFFTRSWQHYDESRQGTRFTLGRMIKHNLSISVSPEFEDIEIRNVKPTAAKIILESKGSRKKLGINVRSIWDTRSPIRSPVKGHILDGDVGVSGLDVDVARFVLSAKKYYKIWDSELLGSHVLGLKFTLGMVTSLSKEKVPVFERFFAGGTGSIRGFTYRGAGPVDKATGETVGGDSLIIYSIEDSFPLYKNVLKGVFFVDVGKAAVGTTDIGFNDMRVSVGPGLRFTLPLFGRMSLGVDFGFVVKKQPTDTTKFVNINIGGAD